MRTARPEDWKTLPLPESHVTLELDRRFSSVELGKLRQGVIPAQMEDKWFVFWRDDTLYFHRSWTGSCLFVVHFDVDDEGCRMVRAEANRDTAQYTETSDERDRQMISYLVDVLLLRRFAEFPSQYPTSELRAIEAWSMMGRASHGQHPGDDAADEESDENGDNDDNATR